MSVQDERCEALLGAAAPLVVSVLDALPDAIGVVCPAVDAADALVDFEVGYTNPSSERMMGVRRPARPQVPRVVHTGGDAAVVRDPADCSISREAAVPIPAPARRPREQ
jgi:hypothetical protein